MGVCIVAAQLLRVKGRDHQVCEEISTPG